MSLYENFSVASMLMRRPFMVLSNAWQCFISGPTAMPPFRVKFESSAVCNLKCVMCPLTVGIKRDQGVLKFENFKKVYDEIKIPYLNLTGLGEPLLNKDLFRIIRYARKHGSLVKVDTNATLLKEESIKELVDSNPTFISVSLDGVTKETYEKIRRLAKFDVVIGNLKKLIEYRNKSGSKTQIHIFFVLQNENLDDLIPFIKFGDSIGVDSINGNIAISFGEAENIGKRKMELRKLDKIRKKVNFLKKEVRAKLSIENIEDFLKHPENAVDEKAHKPCFYPWYTPAITWDGYMVPCDFYCDKEYVYGNVFEKSFMQVWNNDKARAFRKQILKKRVGVCTTCGVDETFIYQKLSIFYRLPILKHLSYRWRENQQKAQAVIQR